MNTNTISTLCLALLCSNGSAMADPFDAVEQSAIRDRTGVPYTLSSDSVSGLGYVDLELLSFVYNAIVEDVQVESRCAKHAFMNSLQYIEIRDRTYTVSFLDSDDCVLNNAPPSLEIATHDLYNTYTFHACELTGSGPPFDCSLQSPTHRETRDPDTMMLFVFAVEGDPNREFTKRLGQSFNYEASGCNKRGCQSLLLMKTHARQLEQSALKTVTISCIDSESNCPDVINLLSFHTPQTQDSFEESTPLLPHVEQR